MRKIYVLLALVASLFVTPAFADWTGKDASLATVTFKNPGVCTSVVCTPIAAIYDPTGVNGAAVPTAGADAQSNTANGLQVYNRASIYNGTTWDRWTGAVTNAGTFAVQLTGAANNINNIAGTVSLPTGASTSANQTSQITQETASAAALGTTADTACSTDNGTCTVIALQKRTNQNLTTVNTTAGASIAAGSALIGKVGIDQTTPGTTNNVAVSYGSVPLVADPCQQVATVRTPISISTAANIKIVTGTSAKKTHICGMMLFSAGTTNVGIVEGSGVNCATSTLGLIGGATAATGPNLTAQAGFNSPPAGYAIASTTVNANDICLINSAAIQVSGYVVTATP